MNESKDEECVSCTLEHVEECYINHRCSGNASSNEADAIRLARCRNCGSYWSDYKSDCRIGRGWGYGDEFTQTSLSQARPVSLSELIRLAKDGDWSQSTWDELNTYIKAQQVEAVTELFDDYEPDQLWVYLVKIEQVLDILTGEKSRPRHQLLRFLRSLNEEVSELGVSSDDYSD